MIDNFTLKQPTQVADQAAAFVRELISSGRLEDGARLPSTAALSKTWGIRVGCVHSALSELVSDGLLVRQPGRGTFVSRSKPTLTAVSVYEMADSLANSESNVHRVLLAELQRQLTAEGIEMHLVVDPRHGDDLAERWEPIVGLSRSHRVGATIALGVQSENSPWISQIPNTSTLADLEAFPGRVTPDFDQLTDLCLQALAEQGCRSVGLMHAAASKKHPEIYSHFTDTASDLGLKVKNKWVMLQDKSYILAGEFCQHGYQVFRGLWSQPQKPDGLMIFPDSFVPGVVLAIAELGVKVPGDLRLAYHRNEQTKIFSPFPATEAILNEREMAAALIAQARRLWSNEPCEPVRISFRRVDKPAISHAA